MSTAAIHTMPQPAKALASKADQMNDEDRLWEAVVERKRELDGAIYYGVMSTGIFCRTVCPARRPKRENVRFFGTPQAAESAGLRACLRCKPKAQATTDSAHALIRAVIDHIEENLEGTITLESIAAAVGQSQFHLQRTFSDRFGISPLQYANARRMAIFKTAVRMGKSVADATYAAGFGSSRALYEKADSHLGMSPANYRKGAKGMAISYAIAACSLGKVLVGRTEKGICKIALGDDASALLDELRYEFPKAQFSEVMSSTELKPVLDLVEGKQKKTELPLDLRGTSFQMRVWKELQKIPLGKTATYEQIAQRIGSPTATRAVARACASNRVALAVPCHRVVRKGGDVSGYRWGVERKKQILARETAKSAVRQ